MTRKIYDQHDAAFRNVSAYVILHKGQAVARVAIKFPRDGAGRLYAYVHWLGVEMQRGFANGYGYDKTSAAVEDAARKIPLTVEDDARYLEPHEIEARQSFRGCLENIGGSTWDRCLRDAGFTVCQAV